MHHGAHRRLQKRRAYYLNNQNVVPPGQLLKINFFFFDAGLQILPIPQH